MSDEAQRSIPKTPTLCLRMRRVCVDDARGKTDHEWAGRATVLRTFWVSAVRRGWVGKEGGHVGTRWTRGRIRRAAVRLVGVAYEGMLRVWMLLLSGRGRLCRVRHQACRSLSNADDAGGSRAQGRDTADMAAGILVSGRE